MSYVDRVETDWPFRVQLPIGTHVPFHCTASGKCFAASLPPRMRRAFVQSLTLDGLTDHTHTDPDTLLEELAEIAANGHSLDREEFVEGMVALAVPVTDPNGRFVAAVAVHGPIQRLSVSGVIDHKEILQRSALRLQQALFSED